MTDPRTPDVILTTDLVYAVFDDFIVPTYGVWGDDESEHRNMIVDAVAEAFKIAGVEALREQVRILEARVAALESRLSIWGQRSDG